MKIRIFLLGLFGALAFTGRAAITPESILPANTFALSTVPDISTARVAIKVAPMTRMWNDPAMAKFTEKFAFAVERNILEPLLIQADFDIDEYSSLLQGQLTFALTRQEGEEIPGVIFILDSGKMAGQLKEKLAGLRESLVDNDVPHDRLRIRGTDFIHVKAPEDRGPMNLGLYLGQSGSLMIASSTKALASEVVALHQNKKKGKSLKQNESFAQRHEEQFKDALGYAWLDFSVVLEIAEEQIEKQLDPDAEQDPNPLAPTPDRVIGALGLKGLRSVSVSMHQDKDGELLHVFFDVPEAGRRGLFAMLAAPAKDATPPAFVGANVTSFGRLRHSGQELWKQFEAMITEITPAVAGVIGVVEVSIRANDPDFNLKEQLIGTLGDDIIVIEQPTTVEEPNNIISPSSLYLMKSTKPAVTSKAIRTLVAAVLPEPPEEREVDGRTIYTYSIGGAFEGAEQAVHLTSVGEYLVLSLDEKALERFLKGPKKDDRKLIDLPGLKEAADKVGGFKSGMFAYESQKPMARSIFKLFRENPGFLEGMLGGLRGPGGRIDPDTGLPAGGPDISEWLDFKLLPEFKKVSKYFHYTVSGMQVTKQGISLRVFAPAPPGLKKQ
ncbi:MAG: hypothetical protein QF685_04860 [Verrucomicrobiota bacterium]|jgi:hypothetical protein|nr:hypothetical protein [Verrucomicrobiota bacterium]